MPRVRRDPLLRGLGVKVKQVRESRGWTQETLAGKAGLDRSYIAGIEAGLRNPSTRALSKLARALSVTLSALFEDVE
jgi:transcriptional regulator with XRE-family HTH domain